jgi:hypothetical protein
MIFLLLLIEYLYLGFLTATVLAALNITIGCNDVDDILTVKNGKTFLEAALLWPIIVFIGLIIGVVKILAKSVKLVCWLNIPLLKFLDSWVLLLKGK